MGCWSPKQQLVLWDVMTSSLQGAVGVEFDVQLTKDLQPVIYHDLMISLNVGPVSVPVTCDHLHMYGTYCMVLPHTCGGDCSIRIFVSVLYGDIGYLSSHAVTTVLCIM